jgi:hypothetical protein
LASHQYRGRIESPVYQPRFQAGDASARKEYVDALKKLLTDKNCVLVASPDVNPMTEIALAALYGVPEDKWFDSSYDLRRHSAAVVALKKRPKRNTGPTMNQSAGRVFYHEAETSEGSHKRGFVTSIVPGIEEAEFFTQSDPSADFKTYAHLVVAPNPFRTRDEDGRISSEKRFLIILNGIGGPATFALTHVLTGGVNGEWAAYPDEFSCPSRSEEDLRNITNDLARLNDADSGVQYIFEIEIGAPGHDTPDTAARTPRGTGETLYTYDTRRVKGWRILDSSNASFKTLRVRV